MLLSPRENTANMSHQITPPRRFNSSQSGISGISETNSTTSTILASQKQHPTPRIKNNNVLNLKLITKGTLIPKQSSKHTSPAAEFLENNRFLKKIALPSLDASPSPTPTPTSTPTSEQKPTLPQVTPEKTKLKPPEARKTKIQVCVRIRPILPADKKYAQHAQNRSSGASVGGGSAIGKAVRRSSLQSTKTRRQSGGRGKFGSINKAHSDRFDNINKAHSDEGNYIPVGLPNPAWTVQPDHCSIEQDPTLNPGSARASSYRFDHCFDPTQSTLDVYNKTVKDSVRAFMEGYHTSVFAYGQTATGKTFTMTGNNKSNDQNSLGIIQLAIQDCFDYIDNEKAEGREFLLRVSFMEIYNEVVNDLLVDHANNPQNNTRSSTPNPLSNSSSNIRIFESKREGVIIRGLKEEIVTSASEVYALLSAGDGRRQTGGTNLNKQSSRSHSIFRLTVESRAAGQQQEKSQHPAIGTMPHKSHSRSSLNRHVSEGSDSGASTFGRSGGPVRVSTLSLVDLAGSESVKNTGSTGTRQKEGQYINKSLLTLGHVVWKLAELSGKKTDGDGNVLDTTHIPYRDSKLTRILQPSLSGQAQIVLICNISPIIKHLEESHNTLKFATRAKRIKQTAIIHEVVNKETLLQNYRDEIDELKRQLRDAKVNASKDTGNENGDNGDNGSGSGSDNGSGVYGEEEMKIIVQAIHNLERLILTTTSAQERKKKKKRKNKYIEDNLIDLDSVLGDSGNSRSGKGFGGMLDGVIEMGYKGGSVHSQISTGGVDDDNDDDDDDHLGLLGIPDSKNNSVSLIDDSLLDLSLISKVVPRSSSMNTKDDMSLTSRTDCTSIGDDTIIEGKKLISDLRRVQGLLGTVLMRKATPSKDNHGASVRRDDNGEPNSQLIAHTVQNAVASPLPEGAAAAAAAAAAATRNDTSNQNSLLLLKNEEVERLRGELHQQAVATSLRQADSSFLQTQLQEKDSLLQEVSKILESVERRQLQLEKENAGWKEDWAKSVATLRAKESECEKTVSLLKAREAEIQQLRKKLDAMKAQETIG